MILPWAQRGYVGERNTFTRTCWYVQDCIFMWFALADYLTSEVILWWFALAADLTFSEISSVLAAVLFHFGLKIKPHPVYVEVAVTAMITVTILMYPDYSTKRFLLAPYEVTLPTGLWILGLILPILHTLSSTYRVLNTMKQD